MTNCSSCRRLSRSTTIGAEKSSPAMHHTVADGGERPSGTVGAQPVQEEIQARLVLRFLLGFVVEGDVDLALVAAFGVPRRFAVTGKQDAHA